jgi:hypothetical protein
MSGETELETLIREGGEARGEVRLRLALLRRETGRLASDADVAARKGVTVLKWGGGAFIASAVLFRLLKLRRGFRGIRWLWSLGPIVARLALSRFAGRRT